MLAPWVINEVSTADLKDKRFKKRFAQVLSDLAARPTASIPAASGGRAEMAGAYRLIANEKTTFDNILQPHIEATRKRVAAQSVVIVVQDTSEIDVTRPQQQVSGAGPLDGNSRCGALLHPLHAFAPDGTPLGTLHATAWVREEGTVCASRSRAERAATPIEEKESYRWVETFRFARDEAERCPATQFVSLEDSEADIYEFLVEASTEPRRVHWIVRACQNRALLYEDAQESWGKHVRDYVLEKPVLFQQTVHVRGRKPKIRCDKRGRRQPRESRKADVDVRAACVTLRPPWRADRKLPPVTVNIVLVRETNPPAGDEPIEWLLITDLPIDTIEQVRQVIQYYCVRWMIEVFFRVLKSGCKVEERLFEYMDRVLTCLAVYMIVAWRTLYVCRLGRSCPEISCEMIFEPAEWKSAWKVVHRQDPPAEPPPLGVFIRLVAQLGGYIHPFFLASGGRFDNSPPPRFPIPPPCGPANAGSTCRSPREVGPDAGQ